MRARSPGFPIGQENKGKTKGNNRKTTKKYFKCPSRVTTEKIQ